MNLDYLFKNTPGMFGGNLAGIMPRSSAPGTGLEQLGQYLPSAESQSPLHRKWTDKVAEMNKQNKARQAVQRAMQQAMMQKEKTKDNGGLASFLEAILPGGKGDAGILEEIPILKKYAGKGDEGIDFQKYGSKGGKIAGQALGYSFLAPFGGSLWGEPAGKAAGSLIGSWLM